MTTAGTYDAAGNLPLLNYPASPDVSLTYYGHDRLTARPPEGLDRLRVWKTVPDRSL